MHYSIWIILGIGFIICEMLVGTMDLLWISVAAFITGGIVFLFEPVLSTQFFIFAAACIALLSFNNFFVKKKILPSEDADNGLNSNNKLIGTIIKVTSATEGGKGRGAVGDSSWMIQSERELQVGDSAKVIEVKGSVLIVE